MSSNANGSGANADELHLESSDEGSDDTSKNSSPNRRTSSPQHLVRRGRSRDDIDSSMSSLNLDASDGSLAAAKQMVAYPSFRRRRSPPQLQQAESADNIGSEAATTTTTPNNGPQRSDSWWQRTEADVETESRVLGVLQETAVSDAEAATVTTTYRRTRSAGSLSSISPPRLPQRAVTASLEVARLDDAIAMRRAKRAASNPGTSSRSIAAAESQTAGKLRPRTSTQSPATRRKTSSERDRITLAELEAKTVDRPRLSNAQSTGTSSELESIDEMAEMQRQRQSDLHQPRAQTLRCGDCDDCLKGLPCLVANLVDAGPGAFSVSEASRVRRRPTQHTLTAAEASLPLLDESFSSHHAPDSPTTIKRQQRRRSSKQVMAVAAVVVDDDEDDERQRELQEQAAKLAERAAQLQAWQEELERQRREMQAGGASAAVRLSEPASVVQAAAVVAVAEEPLEAVTSHHGEQQQQQQARTYSLGSGPLRFAPADGHSTQSQVMGLDSQMQLALREVQRRWDDRQDKLKARHGPACKTVFPLSPQWHMRHLWFHARQSSIDGSYQFPIEKTWRAEKKLQKRYVTLNIASLRPQIESKTLFPVPGLKTMGGHNMFYMRPARYFPGKTSTRTIIDNLCYVMNTMLEGSQFAQKEGIGFIACMDNWKMRNFEVNYCYQFMMALQGYMVPVKTQLFLIVNPPSWFGAIWKIMKPMLAPSFRKRVKICPEFKISKYLAPGYQQFLPDDMRSGRADTRAMVADFIAYRQHAERSGSSGNHDHYQHPSAESVHGSSTGDIDDVGSVSHWSSADGTSSGHDSFGLSGHRRLDDDEDEEDASIHCDIDDEDALEDEDMKPSSRSVVHISNLPSHDEIPAGKPRARKSRAS